LSRTVFLMAVFIATAVATASAGENVLYSFTGGNDCQPYGSLIQDPSGNLYGTTFGDPYTHYGSVYELTKGSDGTWTETVLHTFQGGTDGRNPAAGLVRDQAGNLYGTEPIAGADHAGVVFELTLGSGGWSESIIYTFTDGADGAGPYASLILDQAGNLYGTTSQGGTTGNGVVFKLTPGSGGCTQSVLYSFTGGDDGGWPMAPLAFDAEGNLYGTAEKDGPSSSGVVFKLSPSANGWTQRVVYSFTGGNDGKEPDAGLVRDGAGSLYTSTTGGGAGDSGVVLKLRPNNSALPGIANAWAETLPYTFLGGDDGANPNTGVVFDQAGNLYGTAESNGSGGTGVVYQLTPSSTGWSENVLYSFTGGTDGAFPESTVLLDSAGNIDGTAIAGGTNRCGVVYQITR
jgi:uncharacterized repeat protein (TIGR03803 family)